ncbi:MAG: hypothetical protein QOI55_139, partial [Actinomycetota bacterium]|nr:hypothetical protein [Actinomycetota bacterium]
MSDVVAGFSEMARANACAVHGPIPATDAAGLVAQILRDEAGAGPVALASDDEALRGLALADAV